MDHIEWIKRGLDKPGKTKGGLAKALGIHPSGVTALLRRGRRLKVDEISKVAVYLDDPFPGSPIDHSEAEENDTVKVRTAPVRGETAAGRWIEFEDIDHEKFEPVPYVPTSHKNIEQFAFKVRGASMDLARILDGEYVICVDYWMARRAPTEGDIVVVERRRGPTFERTCKIIEVRDGKYFLASRSSDPKFKTPISVDGDREGDGAEVEIIGLVVGRYAPVGR